jgi:hypothetical protein
MGAILTQKDERGKHLAIGFHSQTFNDTECNYNIHDRELLAVYRGLTHHRHLLLSSPFPVTVLTDHKNLEYYHQCYIFSLLNCAYLTDYHWDRHLYFVITSTSHTDNDSYTSFC